MKIGTRGSPLALAQTREVVRMLTAAHSGAEDEFEIVVIKTTGDMIQDRALAEAGERGFSPRKSTPPCSPVRIPTKPATHSNRKPATDSDLKPAGIPI
jgi:hydroxymethylbilane synthase